MPIVDTSYRCDECDGEYPSVNDAVACADWDRWDKRLSDYAKRMYARLELIANDDSIGNAERRVNAEALVDEIGDPPDSVRP